MTRSEKKAPTMSCQKTIHFHFKFQENLSFSHFADCVTNEICQKILQSKVYLKDLYQRDMSNR